MSSPTVDFSQTNYTKQLQQTLKGYQSTAGGFFNLSNQFAGPYTDLNLRTLAQTLFGSANAPGELPTLSTALTYTRGNDIADVGAMGPVAYAALLRSNPGLAMSLMEANRQGQQIFAPNSLMSRLQGIASEQLGLGGSMSPEELNIIDQGTRVGTADRGIVGTMPALGAELLNRDQYAQQRLGQRIGFATNIEGLANQDRSYLNSLASLNAGLFDPFQTVTGRGSSSLAGMLGGGGVNPLSLMGTLNTTQLFNPNAGADAYNTNLNAQASAKIANANASSGMTGSLIGAGGAIAGGLLLAL
jgi:hypothetical protein